MEGWTYSDLFSKDQAPYDAYRYTLELIDPNGGKKWAIVVFDNQGLLSGVTSDGKFAHQFRSWGSMPFRIWVADILCSDPKYALKAIFGEPNEPDLLSTIQNIMQRILQQRRDGFLDSESAKKEWELANKIHDSMSLAQWSFATSFENSYEYIIKTWPSWAKFFCYKYLPILKKQILIEIGRERLSEIRR